MHREDTRWISGEDRWLNLRDDEVAKFLTDEIALAITLKHPILCVAASEWRIVNFLRIGARTKKTLQLQMSEKSKLFKTEKGQKKILAAGLGAALVYVVGGIVAGVTAALGEALTLIIVDP